MNEKEKVDWEKILPQKGFGRNLTSYEEGFIDWVNNCFDKLEQAESQGLIVSGSKPAPKVLSEQDIRQLMTLNRNESARIIHKAIYGGER